MGYKENRELKVYGMNGYQYRQTAAIRLQGKWLEDLGFEIGDIINVECRDGKLVITKADEIEVEVVG